MFLLRIPSKGIPQGFQEEVGEQLEIFGPKNLMVIPWHFQACPGIVNQNLGWRDLDIIERVPNIELATAIIDNKHGYCTVVF